MITVQGLTKRYGPKLAVDDLTFKVQPGVITGFLGPNGSGKSTTMRMMLGLDAPSAVTVTINGRAYRDIPAPIHEVGALLDAKAVDGARTARQHLAWIAKASGINESRVDEVLGMVGLESAANKKVGGYSLGMSQRFGIAAALMGDPEVLLFDEPVNGLDPDGIMWFRNLMRDLAKEGRTIFVSSHLMSEMQETADHVLVIGKGKLVADASMDEIMARGTGQSLRVRSPEDRAAGTGPGGGGGGGHARGRRCGARAADDGRGDRGGGDALPGTVARALASTGKPGDGVHGPDAGQRGIRRERAARRGRDPREHEHGGTACLA